MSKRKLITQKELKEVLDYDPETGEFLWVRTTSTKPLVGKRAGGARADGYVLIGVKGRRCYAHRLAWLYVYGKWPNHELDHINGNPSDNRIANLRDVPHRQNLRNIKMSKNNTSGYNGVSWDKRCKKWQVFIYAQPKKPKFIGYFDRLEDAVAARKRADLEHGYTIRRGVLAE